jgi:hypothetical protein
MTKPTNAHYIIFIYQRIMDNLLHTLFVYFQVGDIIHAMYINRSLQTIINYKFSICILNCFMYSKPCIFKTWYFTSLHWFTDFCNISVQPFIVTRLPEDGHLSGRNTLEAHYVYHILWNTSVYLLALLPRLIFTSVCFETYEHDIQFIDVWHIARFWWQ